MDFDYRLLAKYLTGMLSPEEMKQVEEWRELSIDNEEAFSKLMKLRVSWKFTQYNTPEHIEKALNGLNARINSRRQFQIFCSVMRYAAVILLLVSFSYGGWGYLKPDNYVTIRVEQGEDVKKIVLADGSAVWLKEGSSLRIPEVFAENNRKLSLQGEAFFDVAKKVCQKHTFCCLTKPRLSQAGGFIYFKDFVSLTPQILLWQKIHYRLPYIPIKQYYFLKELMRILQKRSGAHG